MVATVTGRPVVSLFADCAYCPQSTSFRCLNCQTPICPECCPSDYCPECQPAPVAPLLGWSAAYEGVEDNAVAVACTRCGDRIYVDDPTDDAYCAACAMPAAEVAALGMVPSATPADRSFMTPCSFCGDPMYGTDTDGTRHPRCARFLAGLDARRTTRKEQPIAA
jgi:ribosomal protein L37E